MSAAVNSGFIILAIIMAMNSAIAVYYYMKLIVYMFLKDPVSSDQSIYRSNTSTTLRVIIGFAVFVTCISVIIVEPLLEIISSYVIASGF